MSLEYETVSLGEHLYIKGRIGWKGLKKDEYLDNGNYRIINATALEEDGINWDDCGYITKERFDESPEIILKEKDILISKDGTIGKLGYVKELYMPSTVASGVFVVRNLNNEYIDTDFLYYYFKSPFFKWFIKSVTEGSVIPHLYQRDFTDMEFNLFDLDVQKKCSTILNAIEEKININKRINRNLQNLIKILYKEYFESFELDNVPDDWELVNIGSIIDIYNGYSYKGAELQESDCGMVTIKNFNRDGSFRIDGFKEIVYSHKIKKHHFINENDVLISCTDVTQDADIIGNCIMVLDKQNYDELIMSMDLVKIESKIPEINNFLLASIFKSYNFKKHILGYVNGTTVLHLDKKGIKKFKIALPKDLSELKNISERFELIYAEIQCNQKEINKLTNLRDTLLPKLMSGEIDVSQIDM